MDLKQHWELLSTRIDVLSNLRTDLGIGIDSKAREEEITRLLIRIIKLTEKIETITKFIYEMITEGISDEELKRTLSILWYGGKI